MDLTSLIVQRRYPREARYGVTYKRTMEIALEFRAGKMTFDGKKVVPDPRKGLVRIGRDDEGLVHFQWMERTHNVMEDVS